MEVDLLASYSISALDTAERKVVFGFVRKPTCDACVFKLESNLKCLRRQVGWKKKSCSWVLMSTDITFFQRNGSCLSVFHNAVIGMPVGVQAIKACVAQSLTLAGMYL